MRVLCFISAVFLSSCASPWPSMPTTTYEGRVTSSITKQPVSGALVNATRPGRRGMIVFPVADEPIGTARTDRRGRFSLTTTTGFATKLIASSPDMRQIGGVDVSRRSTETNIYVSPEFRMVSYRAIDPISPMTQMAAEAMKDIIKESILHDSQLESLIKYRERGIISTEQFDLFAQNPHLFFGPDPEVSYYWGEERLAIPDTNSRIRLVAAMRKK